MFAANGDAAIDHAGDRIVAIAKLIRAWNQRAILPGQDVMSLTRQQKCQEARVGIQGTAAFMMKYIAGILHLKQDEMIHEAAISAQVPRFGQFNSPALRDKILYPRACVRQLWNADFR